MGAWVRVCVGGRVSECAGDGEREGRLLVCVCARRVLSPLAPRLPPPLARSLARPPCPPACLPPPPRCARSASSPLPAPPRPALPRPGSAAQTPGRGRGGQGNGYHKEIGVSQAGPARKSVGPCTLQYGITDRTRVRLLVTTARPGVCWACVARRACGGPCLRPGSVGVQRVRVSALGSAGVRGGVGASRAGRSLRHGCHAAASVDAGARNGCGVMVNRGGFRGHKYWAGRGKIL